MEALILALTIELEYNRAAKEDQIRKKLQKHPIKRRLLSTKLEIPQIMEVINKWMTQLKTSGKPPPCISSGLYLIVSKSI